jgi:hypothetical protein
MASLPLLLRLLLPHQQLPPPQVETLGTLVLELSSSLDLALAMPIVLVDAAALTPASAPGPSLRRSVMVDADLAMRSLMTMPRRL